MSVKQRLDEALSMEKKNEKLDDHKTTTSSQSLEETSLIRLYVYSSIWLFYNIALIGFVIFFWEHVIEAGFNGVNYGKFIVVSHAAVIFGLYKVNKKYFKFIVLLANKLV